LAKTKSALAVANQCQYRCVNGKWKLEVDNSPPGFFCPLTQPGACNNGAIVSTPAVPNPPPSLAANSAEYVFNKSSKSLHFKDGTCGKGKHFPPAITIKELAKLDPDAAELVKSMQKNKRIASFSIVLKAQKVESA
jgi:hypothetical protein